MEKLYRNKEWLEDKLQQGISASKIASLCNTCPGTVLRWMRNFNLPTPRPKKPWHCEISPEMKEFLNGLLLGGGSLSIGEGGDSASFRVSSEKLEYLEWAKKKLKEFGISPVAIRTIKQKTREKTYIYTREYHELLAIYHLWYREGVKDVPLDFCLTPNTALCWFLRGGHLEISDGKKRKAIRIWVDRYSPAARKRLISELEKIGIHPSLYEMKRGTMIRIPTAESEIFLNYIGECPEELREAFGYKWETIRKR